MPTPKPALALKKVNYASIVCNGGVGAGTKCDENALLVISDETEEVSGIPLRLCASAPALVAALQGLLPLAERGIPGDTHPGPCTPESGCDQNCADIAAASKLIEAARAALLAATGTPGE